MFRSWLLFSICGAVSCVEPAPLAFASALEIASRESPEIAVESAAVDAAEATSISAGRLPDPKLAVGIDNLPITGDERGSLSRDFMTMRTVGVMQEVPNRTKRQAARDIAAAGVTQAQSERRVRVLAIRRATATAWLNRFYAEHRLALFDDLERENHLFAESVQAQLAGGRGSAADAVVPQQEALELADRRDALGIEIAKAKADLKRWVGDAADGPLGGEPPVLAIDTEHLRSHVHEHPEIAVFEPMTEKAQAELHAAQAAKRPDWGVELAYGRRGAEFSDMVSLQFTIGLPIFGATRQDPQISAARHELARIDAQRSGMLREHTAELEGDLATFAALKRQIARVHEASLPLVRQKIDYKLAAYRSGSGTLTAVLAARRELLDAQLKQIELEAQLATLTAQLYFVYGEGAQ